MDRRLDTPDAGFTLVELMIVVTVLALLTTTVALTANRPRGAISTDSARFRVIHDRLREQAVLSRQLLGLKVDGDGYQRLRWDGADWQVEGGVVRWRGAVSVEQPFDRRVPLQFAPSGQSTPLRIRFEGASGATVCTGAGWDGVSCGAS